MPDKFIGTSVKNIIKGNWKHESLRPQALALWAITFPAYLHAPKVGIFDLQEREAIHSNPRVITSCPSSSTSLRGIVRGFYKRGYRILSWLILHRSMLHCQENHDVTPFEGPHCTLPPISVGLPVFMILLHSVTLLSVFILPQIERSDVKSSTLYNLWVWQRHKMKAQKGLWCTERRFCA